MWKALTRPALVLLAASLCATAAAAQTTLEWIVLSPAGEEFTARMPKEPLRLEQEVRAEGLVASGRRYTATAPGGARYVVWSLADAQHAGTPVNEEGRAGRNFPAESRRLDLVAEAAWEFLVSPEFERRGVERLRTGTNNNFIPRMSFHRTFELGGRAAREYSVRLEKEGGPVYVCADGARLYVVAALAPDPLAADSKRFVESFGLKALPPPTVVGGDAAVAPVAPPAAEAGTAEAPADDNRPFRQGEVVKKAVITYKPEPGYTESARKFGVTGVVRLRAILSNKGEMTNIAVVKHLPHGLTEKAMEAARLIRFEPAQWGGRAVSQYVVLEYNFNIY